MSYKGYVMSLVLSQKQCYFFFFFLFLLRIIPLSEFLEQEMRYVGRIFSWLRSLSESLFVKRPPPDCFRAQSAMCNFGQCWLFPELGQKQVDHIFNYLSLCLPAFRAKTVAPFL